MYFRCWQDLSPTCHGSVNVIIDCAGLMTTEQFTLNNQEKKLGVC